MAFPTVLRARTGVAVGALGVMMLGIGARQLPPAESPVLQRLIGRIKSYYALSRPEKAYLQLDKPLYAVGETVWFRAYVLAADTHRPDTISHVLHVDLLAGNGRVAARRELRLNDGLAHGDFALPDSLRPGTYRLRAYTAWMRNADPGFFYERRLEVWPTAVPATPGATPYALRKQAAAARSVAAAVAQAPDVQFFPEGGRLVAGLDNTLAFKANDSFGRGLDVEGKVLDAQNREVAVFRSSHLGMGSFVLKAVAGQRYHAVVAPAGRPVSVPLPEVQASGYTLHVLSLNSAFLVTIQQRGTGGGPVLLLGQVRGTVAYAGEGQVTGNELFTTRIPKTKFPAGIVQFTLFDGQGQPLAERLAFAQTDPGLRVALVPDRASYGPRQPVRLRVSVTDAAGQRVPAATRLAVAVTDAGAVVAGAETIASHLLLTSDLAGYVEAPGYYFEHPTPETALHLDQLLLTQGWRRFAWQPNPADKVPDFGVEQGLTLRGQVTQRNGKPAPGTQLTYLQTTPQKVLLRTAADAEGRFLFTGLGACSDTTRVVVQARKDKGGSNLLVNLDLGPAAPARPLPPLPLQPPAELAATLRRSQAQVEAQYQFRLDTTKTILLNNVTVKGRRAEAVDPRRPYPQAAATVLRVEEMPAANSGLTALQVLQGRVPGVTITGADASLQVQIRGVTSLSGSNEPLFLLDGVPVTKDVLQYYPASDVETIEILKGGQAAIFGSRGSGGVIAVYTRRGSSHYPMSMVKAPGMAAARVAGYYCGREFYVPRYDLATTKREYPDLRQSTLYWNPTVTTDASGQADLTFFTSDAKGSFRLTAEGVAGSGQPVVGSGTLRVE